MEFSFYHVVTNKFVTTWSRVILDVTQVDRSRSPQGEEIAYYTALAEVDRFDFGVCPFSHGARA